MCHSHTQPWLPQFSLSHAISHITTILHRPQSLHCHSHSHPSPLFSLLSFLSFSQVISHFSLIVCPLLTFSHFLTFYFFLIFDFNFYVASFLPCFKWHLWLFQSVWVSLSQISSLIFWCMVSLSLQKSKTLAQPPNPNYRLGLWPLRSTQFSLDFWLPTTVAT